MCELAEIMGDWFLKHQGYLRLTQLDPNNIDYAYKLGHALRQTGDYENAAPILELCLQKFTYDLGADNPRTMTVLNTLAGLRYKQKRLKDAVALYRDCLSRRRKTLTSEHPDTLRSMNNLALALAAQHKFKAALPLYQECLVKRRSLLGEGHPDTVGTLMHMGALERDSGHAERAHDIYRECLGKYELSLGKAHSYTLRCKKELDRLDQDSKAPKPKWNFGQQQSLHGAMFVFYQGTLSTRVVLLFNNLLVSFTTRFSCTAVLYIY